VSVTVNVEINGIEIPVMLGDDALAALMDALGEDVHQGDGFPEWMNVTTAAAYLDVSVQRLRKLVATKQIPFVQEAPACRIFFSRSDLDRWMRGFQQQVRGGDA
jgi:excisionase family DNA binding protein